MLVMIAMEAGALLWTGAAASEDTERILHLQNSHLKDAAHSSVHAPQGQIACLRCRSPFEAADHMLLIYSTNWVPRETSTSDPERHSRKHYSQGKLRIWEETTIYCISVPCFAYMFNVECLTELRSHNLEAKTVHPSRDAKQDLQPNPQGSPPSVTLLSLRPPQTAQIQRVCKHLGCEKQAECHHVEKQHICTKPKNTHLGSATYEM